MKDLKNMKPWFILTLVLSLQTVRVHSISALDILNKASEKLARTNFALGTFSRSNIVASVSQSLRGEEDAKVRESLNQAIVTLSVLDIGGGALVPLTEHIVDTIAKKKSFEATMNAWGVYNEQLKSQLGVGNWDTLDDRVIKDVLRREKAKVLDAFDRDVSRLGANSKTLKRLNSAKRWFRLKSAGKVLGPLFDTVSIGVNSWALHTAIRDCNADPSNCNHGSIAAATLSIASGIVGVGTFIASLAVTSSVLGPVGAVVSLVLAIGATLIEMFYKPPQDQAEIDYQRKLSLVKSLDRYSRFQLFVANKFMIDNKIEKGDLYVVNQGHLPKWFSPTVKVAFGLESSKIPRKIVNLPGVCDRPSIGTPSAPQLPNKPNVCPLLIDGKDIKGDRNEDIGQSFYGFTKDARSIWKGHSITPNQPYSGSVILVNTDKVQKADLKKENFDDKLRGVWISTKAKGNSQPYDDLVSIGSMGNLDASESVKIVTGRGNDALNIDGLIGMAEGRLEAHLGEGHNTLSFLGMAEGSEIKGIEYSPKDSKLHYFLGNERRKLFVGTVQNVEVLGASPFDDVIKLYAEKAGSNGDDFTVFKFNGRATYIFDMQEASHLQRSSFSNRVPHFKIIDSTDNGEGGDARCNNHKPLLKIINCGSDAVANDILYDGSQIKVYGKESSADKRNLVEATFKAMIHPRFWPPLLRFRNRPTSAPRQTPRPTSCSGEPQGRHPQGGKDGKKLIAKISFHSKCPGEIEALNMDGSCMMAPRMLSEVDIVFFGGDRFIADFTKNVASKDTDTPVSDMCTLKCPDQQVTAPIQIKLGRGANDYLVIRNDIFLDRCKVDGEEAKLLLRKVNSRKWSLIFEGEHEKFTGAGKIHEIKGVERVINEYGEDIVENLKDTDEIEFDLFGKYTEKTVAHLADDATKERSKEIGAEMKKCLAAEDESSTLDASVCQLD